MSPVQSIERAIAILKTFSVDEPEIGVGELSRQLNIPKSTVFRILQTLESGGLISQNPLTEKYRLGTDLIALGDNVHAFSDLQQVARSYLRKLSQSLEETVNLSVFDGSEIVNLEQFVTPRKLIMRVGWVGRRMPVHAVSSGKAIIAFLPEEIVDKILSKPLEAYTTHTITDPAALRDELKTVRVKGCAATFEEFEIGLNAISAPIFNRRNHVVASASVSGPSYRLTRARVEEIRPHLLATTQEISYQLGFRNEQILT